MYNVKPSNHLNREEDGCVYFTITDETDWVTDDPIGFEEVPDGVIVTRMASGRYRVDPGNVNVQFEFYARIHNLFRSRLRITVNAKRADPDTKPIQLEIPNSGGVVMSNDFQATLPNSK